MITTLYRLKGEEIAECKFDAIKAKQALSMGWVADPADLKKTRKKSTKKSAKKPSKEVQDSLI